MELGRSTNIQVLKSLTCSLATGRDEEYTIVIEEEGNVVRRVHKAEIITLHEEVCDKEGHVKSRPSTRSLWNILNMCPASQRKILAGLDNIPNCTFKSP